MDIMFELIQKAVVVTASAVPGFFLVFRVPAVIRPFKKSDPNIQQPMIWPQRFTFKQILIPSLCVMPVILLTLNIFLDKNLNPDIGFDYIMVWGTINYVMAITKIVVGRLRPNFLASHGINVNPLDTDYDTTIRTIDGEEQKLKLLTGIDWFYFAETRKSFFSGHSMCGSFSCTILSLYILRIFPINLMSSLMSMSIFIIGFYPGISQYLSQWHFLSDVVVGFIIGIAGAILFNAFYIT